ncbi:class I SAM-dependent rRNA methyltransferase, partial [Psychrobacter sanguinis]|nr:class I SAM-dependent rRNA methyltransferase [Psychrobacter sanguinis]
PVLDQLVQLVNQSHQVIGTAYVSKQNKGIGWYLGKGIEHLTVSYFVSLFEAAKQRRTDFSNSDFTNAYRVFNQDGDHFGGLTIDLYK